MTASCWIALFSCQVNLQPSHLQSTRTFNPQTKQKQFINTTGLKGLVGLSNRQRSPCQSRKIPDKLTPLLKPELEQTAVLIAWQLHLKFFVCDVGIVFKTALFHYQRTIMRPVLGVMSIEPRSLPHLLCCADYSEQAHEETKTDTRNMTKVNYNK